MRPASIQLHALPELPPVASSLFPPPPPPPLIPAKPTEPITLDFGLGPFLDLTLDPGQNLIAVAIRASNGSRGRFPLYQIHLMDMAGKPREGVKKQVFDVDVTMPDVEYGANPLDKEGIESGRMLLQVLEETLICLVSNTLTEMESETVICWNWKTGEEISVSRSRFLETHRGGG